MSLSKSSAMPLLFPSPYPCAFGDTASYSRGARRWRGWVTGVVDDMFAGCHVTIDSCLRERARVVGCYLTSDSHLRVSEVGGSLGLGGGYWHVRVGNAG
jgi:hypothetical protein